MLFIQSALDKEELAEVAIRLKALPAGAVRRGKAGEPQHNDSKARAVMGWVKSLVTRHPLVQAYAQPARFSTFILTRHMEGERFGLHPIDPLMKDENGNPMRTDLTFTLFLTPKLDYDGGALTLEANDGTRDIRLEAGDMVIHKTSQLHQVAPVIRGERLACVGWIHSLTKREDERDILFDLQRMLLVATDRDQVLMLRKTIGNLVRMWGEV
ncbi:Fe2+-dependent dioxygenase [Asticcacaulis sp. AC402]|uniref:Fe2+-dependent dioxygenase n=1 Tax=Asticcacaulis sp. AC402 TaxID=1282361 RepID=UPI0003C3D507|nr:Fe2+-dependent dioxygenase [Asticcacaulis sp. AC402]ESQ77172.1 hypothetical protein ABAC402_01870 [Asticcacaulis sp. AC402]